MTTTQAKKDKWFAQISTLEFFEITNQFSEIAYKPYFPKSLNFLPVTSPFFRENKKVYAVKTRKVKDEAELEAYLDDTPNVALYYAAMSTDGPARHFEARFANLDTDYLSPITIEEFYETHKENMRVSDDNFGTLSGLKSQMGQTNGLGLIAYLTEESIPPVSSVDLPTTRIRIEKLITDGKLVYI